MFLLLLLVQSAVAANVLHRVNVQDKFSPRSTFDVSGEASIESIGDDILSTITKNNWNSAFYQVALSPGDSDNTPLDISSVKACHLATATAEHFTLHLASDNQPFSIDYYVSPIPKDGSCPPYFTKQKSLQIRNTTLRVTHPSSPPSPALRIPPPLTPQGEAVKPQPEKTFLQKYWLYIATALVLMLFVGGPPEEEGQPGGGSQSAPAPARR